MNTFVKAPTESVIVYIRAWSPSFFLASLTILVTRITRIIRASWGPIENEPAASAAANDIIMSVIDEITIKQSNLFEFLSRYLHE